MKDPLAEAITVSSRMIFAQSAAIHCVIEKQRIAEREKFIAIVSRSKQR